MSDPNVNGFITHMEISVGGSKVDSFELQTTMSTILTGGPGLSAYQEWLTEGNTGSFDDFLEAIRGPVGLSPYEEWLEQGYTGTYQDFLDSISNGDGGTAGVTSFMTRTGAVTLLGADVTTALGYTAASEADLAFLLDMFQGFNASVNTALGGKVDKVNGYGLSQTNFTQAEKDKLAAIEASHFKGNYLSLAALEAAHTNAAAGDYAYVDAGAGYSAQMYIWDFDDYEWVVATPSSGAGGGDYTPAQIKELYESNPDTYAFTYNHMFKLDNLSNVAMSGVYSDLTGRPNLALVATTGNYLNLSNTPVLADVATTGSYANLVDTPFFANVAMSGDYNDLFNRPTLTPAALGAATAAQGTKADNAVPTSTYTAGMSLKVDKQDGYGLSQANFTTAEKAKLAAIEASHYRGSFVSLVQLTSNVPAGVAGDYADVDPATAGTDALRYIWDVNDSKWVPGSSGTTYTAAQIKALYEANPDTNAYTGAEKTKLNDIATGATKNTDTDSLPESGTPTNLWFTNARAIGATLAGLVTNVGGTIANGDSLVVAIGKLIKNLADHVGATGTAHGAATQSEAGFMSATDKAKLDGLSGGVITIIDRSADFTFGPSDMNNTTRHPATDTTARTFAIAANAVYAAPIGSTIVIDNNYGAGTITITIGGTDVLSLVGPNGLTGTRQLLSGGQATLVKQGANLWRISGVGLQ